jgi:hypothetical protein
MKKITDYLYPTYDLGGIKKREIGTVDLYKIRLIQDQRDNLFKVLVEVQRCSEYWSEYDVPVGLHDRIKDSISDAVVMKWEDIEKILEGQNE